MLSRNRIYALILFTSIFAFALVLKASYKTVPETVLPPTPFSSYRELGALAFDHRPLPKSSIMAIGLPRFNPAYAEIVSEFAVRAKQSQPQLFVLAPAGFEIKGAETGAETFDPNPQKLNLLFARLRQLIVDQKPVLVVLQSTEATHRYARNFMTQLESLSQIQIPTTTFTEIALDKQDEANLEPICRASLRDGEGGVFDLGCLILKISRKFQARGVAKDHNFAFEESEMNAESIFAIYATIHAGTDSATHGSSK